MLAGWYVIKQRWLQYSGEFVSVSGILTHVDKVSIDVVVLEALNSVQVYS